MSNEALTANGYDESYAQVSRHYGFVLHVPKAIIRLGPAVRVDKGVSINSAQVSGIVVTPGAFSASEVIRIPK